MPLLPIQGYSLWVETSFLRGNPPLFALWTPILRANTYIGANVVSLPSFTHYHSVLASCWSLLRSRIGTIMLFTNYC